MQSQFKTENFDGLRVGENESEIASDDLVDELSAENGTDIDDADEDELDLPVDPDEGMPVIPDDERVIEVPS